MIHLEEFVKRQIETKISRILCPLTAILPPDFSGGRTCIQSIKEKSCGHIQIIFPAVSRIPLPDCGFERRSVGAGGGNGFQPLQVANLSYSYLSVTIGQLPVGNCRVFSRDSGFCREEKFCYLSGWNACPMDNGWVPVGIYLGCPVQAALESPFAWPLPVLIPPPRTL